MIQSQKVRDAIKNEYVKCAQDSAYFMKKYCQIQHPMRGKIPFLLYDFQESVLREFQEHRYNIILKSRQLGLSTLVAGYALWLMTFHGDKSILVVATRKETAKNMITKVRVMHHQLPSWLRNQCTEDNKLSLIYKNGSQIKAVSSNEDAARSESLSLLILDEVAFIPNIDGIWAGAQQTLATGGDCIALSTPNGVGNFFHRTWSDAIDGANEFNFIGPLYWYIHPDRNQEWRDEQDKLLGPDLAAQECDCSFLTSGDMVVDGTILEWYKETKVKPPIEKRGIDSNVWIWEQPNYTKDYVLSADVARGDGTDNSAFHVIDIENLQLVAEYRGKLSTRDFGNLCVNMGTEYNNALVVIENTSIGWAAIQQAIDRGYENLFYASKDLKYVDTAKQMTNRYRSEERKMVPGFTMTMKTRPLVISKLEEYFREKSINAYSERLIDELFVFIWLNGKAEAMRGYNDDLVMSVAIGLWVRDTALRLKAEGIRLQKDALEHISSNQGVYKQNDNKNDSWEIEVNGNKENLTWLIDK